MPIMKNKNLQFKDGYTLMELLVSLAILSLLTVALLSTGFGNRDAFSEVAFEEECDSILFALLQYQNESIMDGYRRQVRFRDEGMEVLWTKAGVNHRDYIPAKTLTFSGNYTGSTVLNLYEHGTVSQAGTVYLTSFTGVVRKIVVQVGNGRIYLDEP